VVAAAALDLLAVDPVEQHGQFGGTLAWLADTRERIRVAESRLVNLREQMCALRQRRLDADEMALALARFGPVWESLAPRNQAELVQLLIEKVEFDGVNG
jgi:site-specific DNA recombinase